MRKYLIVILLCIGCNLATALQKIFVFHINGIGTTQGQATANKIALESSVMIQSNDIANNGHFDLLYNSDESTAFCGLCNQLMDVFRQKKYENLSNEEFIEAYMKDYNLNYPKDSPEYKQLESTIQEKYFGDSRFVGANFTDIESQFFSEVVSDKFRYFTECLNNDSRINTINNPVPIDNTKPFVILLPHSQGNIYASELIKSFIAKGDYPYSQAVAVGIATPTNKSSALQDYITSASDKIINALRVFSFPRYEILPANIDIPNPLFNSGHGLIDNYLADESSQVIIRDKISTWMKQQFLIAGSQVFDTSSPYKYWYQIIYDNHGNMPNRLKLLDPSGKDILCTTQQECEAMGQKYFCQYSDAHKETYCTVYINTMNGQYTALVPRNNGWNISVVGFSQNTFYCYQPDCKKDESGVMQCMAPIVQSDAGCHMTDTMDDYYFQYEYSLPQMFNAGYYKSFWFGTK